MFMQRPTLAKRRGGRSWRAWTTGKRARRWLGCITSRSWNPFPDKTGTGWHVVIRYREGHERLIEGFAAKAEAVDWLEANAGQVR